MPFWNKKKTENPEKIKVLKKGFSETTDEWAFKVVCKCLKEIHQDGVLTEKLLKNTYDHIKTFESLPGDTILKYGSKGKGIYIIINGEVEILDNVKGEDIVIGVKNPGEYFGEISTIFDIYITASVRSASRCQLLFLSKSEYKKLFKKPELSLIDWFVKKRYIPTKLPGLEDGRIIRRHVLQVLSHIPLLYSWDEQIIKRLILSMDPDIIRIYPPNSSILLPGDPVHDVFILINGSIHLKDGEDAEGYSIEIDKNPVAIAETDFFRKETCRISVVAQSYCQMVKINRDILEAHLIEEDDDRTKEWQNLQDMFVDYSEVRMSRFITPSLSVFQMFEVLLFVVSQSPSFQSVSQNFIYRMILKSNIHYLESNQQMDITHFDGLLQVLKGGVNLYFKDTTEIIRLVAGELSWCDDIEYIENIGDNDVLIIQYSNSCLQYSCQYCTESDKQINWIDDIILNYSQHSLHDI